MKGDLGAAVALGSGSYLAANAQTAGGCSLMVWENDNNGRQRWCTRLIQGGGFAGALFDGFDNLYVGQPGADPVVSGHPVDPLALPGHRNAFDAKASRQQSTAGGDPSRAGAGVRRPPRRRRRATRSTWSPTSTRRIRSAAWPTARRPGRSARSPRRPLSRRPPRRSSSAVWQPGAPDATLQALRYQPGPDAAADPGVDQRRRHRRRAGKSGAVRRRQDRLRQRPQPVTVGTQHRRRQREMVCAAGLPGADTAHGGARWPDPRRRRPGHRADRRSKTTATTPRWCGAAAT